jgi:hypothetical protein
MNEQRFRVIKLVFVGLITLNIWSILIWQHLHEGVPSHYLLQSSDLPNISNWWGGLVLPVLTWLALAGVHKRILKSPPEHELLLCKKIFIRFFIALCYGAMLSLSFVTGFSEISSVMFPAILLFAMFIRVYREEFILGFILSMSFTFGAVLPTIFGALIAIVSAIVYFCSQFIYAQVKKLKLAKPKR